MVKSLRQEAIVDEVMRRGLVSVTALAERLRVSEVTIRRDLDELDRAGRVQRVRSGAQRPVSRQPEPSAIQRQLVQPDEKRAIGLVGASLVNDGDVIGLHLGTTVLELARALAARPAAPPWHHLQVITNGLGILDALVHVPGVEILLVGGVVHRDEMGTLGLITQETMARLHIDKLFIGCRGFDSRIGTTHDLDVESAVGTERAFVAAARQVIVLADHTKFGQVYPLQSIPIAEVDTVITDDLTPEPVLAELAEQDIKVIVAKRGNPWPGQNG